MTSDALSDERVPPDSNSSVRRCLVLFATVVALAVGAQISVPMVPVPMTLQTLALAVGAGLSGAVWGGMAALAYLVAAVLGLPVLADGKSAPGMALFELGTFGYLVAFVPAAFWIGRVADRVAGRSDGVRPLVRVMVVAHLLILVVGMLWISRRLPLPQAFQIGFRPFLIGALVKSLVAAWIVHAVRSRRDPTAGSAD